MREENEGSPIAIEKNNGSLGYRCSKLPFSFKARIRIHHY